MPEGQLCWDINTWNSCILTLDHAINQRLLSTGNTSVNKWKQSHDWLEIMGVRKWYMQMLTWGSESVGVSVSLKSDPVIKSALVG